MIDIVIDLCGGLSYMTFAVAAARRPGGLGAVRRNRLPPPLALGGGGGHQAAKQMEEEGKRKGGRKDGVAVISLDGRSPLYVAQGVANGVGIGPDTICRCLPSV